MSVYEITNNCKDISVYLGNKCNFDCHYCDRVYIESVVGGQTWSDEDTEELIEYLSTINDEDVVISFHGGEPFVFIKQMEKIHGRLADRDFSYFIQTNGSLITKHKKFFEKYGEKLSISISYDFAFQAENRTAFNIAEAVQVLKSSGVKDIQFQYVIPTNNFLAFSATAIGRIADECYYSGITNINLIPLRHIRGKDRFDIVFKQEDIGKIGASLTRMVTTLYMHGINVTIDGHSKEIDKHYFDDHKQIVLSPDGYVYPEYDFLEYRMKNSILGRWKSSVPNIIPIHQNLEQEICKTCKQNENCGLKFLYKEFGKKVDYPTCKEFYSMITDLINYNFVLKTRENILDWIKK